MAYEPIPDDELVEPERSIALAGADPESTTKILAHLDAAAYGFLLVPEAEHPMAKVITQKWSLLEHRSGDRLVLVAFQPPAQWAAAIVDRWKQRLGDDFDEVMGKWQTGYGLEDGAAYQYENYFDADPPLRDADMPCLVLFCDREQREAVVQPIPDWTVDELYAFLSAVIDTVNEHADDPVEERLGNIAHALVSPSAQVKLTLGHLLGRALDYAKKHPATLVKVAVTALGTLAAGGLPIPGAVLAAGTALEKGL